MRGPQVLAGVALTAAAAVVLTDCTGQDTSGNVYGTPPSYATTGVAVSNACGLLPLAAVRAALGDVALSAPQLGTDSQPPNCTWTTAEAATGTGEVVLEVSSDPATVARVQLLVSPPLGPGLTTVRDLGTAAVVDEQANVAIVLRSGSVLTLSLNLDPGRSAADAAVAVRLARIAMAALAGRRPGPGQLLLAA